MTSEEKAESEAAASAVDEKTAEAVIRDAARMMAADAPDDGTAVPRLMLLADRAIAGRDEDKLGAAIIADAVASLISDPTTLTPLTVAVNAPWGAGKTSVAQLVEERLLAQPNPPVTVWFNAWLNDDADHLGPAFAGAVARDMNLSRGTLNRVLRPLPASMLNGRQRRRRRMLMLSAAALAALTAAVVLYLLGLETLFGQFGDATVSTRGAAGAAGATVFVIAWLAMQVWARARTAAAAAASFVSNPTSQADRGNVDEVRAQLRRLTREAQERPRRARRRVVIFVDDLERARPPRPVEICETASQLLDHEGVVTVILGDLSAVAAAADARYRESAGAEAATGVTGRLFLQKIIQFQVDLPPSRTAALKVLTRASVDQGAPATRAHHEGAPGDRPLGARVRAMVRRLRDTISRLRDRVKADELGTFYWLAVTAAAVVAAVLTDSTTRVFWIIFAAIFGLLAIVAVLEWALEVHENWAIATGLAQLQGEVDKWATGARKETSDNPAMPSSELHDDGIARVQAMLETLPRFRRSDTVRHRLEFDGTQMVEMKIREIRADDSLLRREAEAIAAEFLPPLPRSTKRLINRLRFNLYVGDANRLFDDGSVTASQCGKWTVFQERWPELSWAVGLDPTLLGRLETAAGKGEALVAMNEIARSRVIDVDVLGRFLRSEPALTAVAAQLVHLHPIVD